MANTTWKQVVYDVTDGIRTLLGTSSTIPVGDLKGKLTGITRKAAATYIPSTSAQTIAAGQYLAGAQTISAVPTETKTATPSTSSQSITPSSGKFLSKVTVNAISTETKSVTAGTSATTVTPTSGKYLTSVTVNPTPSQTKTVTPSSSAQTVTPDSGKLLSKVTVNAADMSSVDIVNGVIEEYYSSSGTISAGTFVEFVNEVSSGEQIVSAQSNYIYALQATVLDSDRVLLTFVISYGQSLSMAVVTVTEDSYSIGTIVTNSNSWQYPYVTLIADNKVLLTGAEYSQNPTYAMVCTISGTTITMGTRVQIDTASSGLYTTSVKIADNKAIILHGDGSTAYLAGTVITVSGTTITAGTKCVLFTETSSAMGPTGLVVGELLCSPTTSLCLIAF